MLLQIKHVSLVCFLLNNEIQLLFFSFFFLFSYLISNRPHSEIYKTCLPDEVDGKVEILVNALVRILCKVLITNCGAAQIFHAIMQ